MGNGSAVKCYMVIGYVVVMLAAHMQMLYDEVCSK